MCYDIKASLESQLNRAQRKGDEKAIREIKEKLVPYTQLPIFHASGFSHPKLLIYTNRSPYFPEVAVWGLVPRWVQDGAQLHKLWNNTLNARGETIFEKPSFREAAKTQRCILYVDGFYEHHHFKGHTYPFYIYLKNGSPIAIAGLYNEWTDRATGEIVNTFTIVTTEGNSLLRKIHNNPKLEGPRMPLILSPMHEDAWLGDATIPLEYEDLKALIHSYPEKELACYTVHRLRGKDYLGNVAETSAPYVYQELENVIC